MSAGRYVVVTDRLRRTRPDDGFTVIELLVAMVITIMILAAITNLVIVAHRTDQDVQDSSRSSQAAFTAATYFDADVAAATAVGGVNAVQRAATGCGGTQAAVVLTGVGKTDPVDVRSYTVRADGGHAVLERRTCVGATAAAALAADHATRRIARVEPGSVTVTCDSDTTVPPGGDAGCRRVTLSFRTDTGRDVSVEGLLTSVATPTPTTTPTPVTAPTTGTCTIVADQTTWGATGGAAGSSSSTHAGDALMYTYNDSNQRRSFLHFDLTRPCEPGGTWPTLPGGRSLTSVKLQLAYMGHNNAYCSIFPGISYDGHVIQALDTPSTWSEATLTGSNMPGAMRGSTYTFNRGNQGALTDHVDSAITTAVTGWYNGTWTNNGFRLSRSSVGDTCGRSSQWASRSNGNAALRPRLVITWGAP